MRRIYVICFITINIIIFPLIACDNILNDGIKNQGIQKNLVIPFLCSVEWKLLFEDDFDDGILNTEYGVVNPAQVSETGGYLQVNIDIADNGGYVYLDLPDMSSYAELKAEFKVLYHEGSSQYSIAYVRFWDGLYGGSPTICNSASFGWHGGNPRSGIWFNAEGSTPQFKNITSTERQDTWITSTFIYKYRAGILEYVNEFGESDYFNVITTTSNDFCLLIIPGGWFTGHYMRIDDLKIYAR